MPRPGSRRARAESTSRSTSVWARTRRAARWRCSSGMPGECRRDRVARMVAGQRAHDRRPRMFSRGPALHQARERISMSPRPMPMRRYSSPGCLASGKGSTPRAQVATGHVEEEHLRQRRSATLAPDDRECGREAITPSPCESRANPSGAPWRSAVTQSGQNAEALPGCDRARLSTVPNPRTPGRPVACPESRPTCPAVR